MTGPARELVVTREVDLRLVVGGDEGLRVPASLHYDAAEPFAVSATFTTADGEVTWIFARDLLREGLTAPSGVGDVALWPSRTRGQEIVCLSLSSPNGHALLEADLAALEEFVRRTDAIVPAGEESDRLDIDAALAALLDAEGGSASA